MFKGISINKEVLSKYSDEQLNEWLAAHKLDAKELPALKKELGITKQKPSAEAEQTN